MNHFSGQVRDNHERRRFELEVDGQKVIADYRRSDNVFAVTHVEAPHALRGQGAAGALMKGMMELIKRDGLKIQPICPYAVRWLQRHPEYQDLIAQS